MNSSRCYSLLLGAFAFVSTAGAVTPISSGHIDVGIAYDLGAFDLHVHDEENDVGYSAADALLIVRIQALQFSPGGDFGFLGPAGAPVWILPQARNTDLLHLGIGAEELAPSDWTGNIDFSLKAVSGPGNFYLWDNDSFGRPIVKMDSANGIGPDDVVSVIPGSHSHLNWGFSAPGSYRISFEAAGISVADGPQTSSPVAYNFEVVPEPSGLALAAVGLGGMAFMLHRGRHQAGIHS